MMAGRPDFGARARILWNTIIERLRGASAPPEIIAEAWIASALEEAWKDGYRAVHGGPINGEHESTTKGKS